MYMYMYMYGPLHISYSVPLQCSLSVLVRDLWDVVDKQVSYQIRSDQLSDRLNI